MTRRILTKHPVLMTLALIAAPATAQPGLAETAAKSAVRSIGSAVGREIIRGVLGSILGGSSSRRR